MFFKREKESTPGFAAQLDQIRSAGFAVQSAPGGQTIAARGPLAALLKEDSSGRAAIAETGLWLNNELAVLTDVGFQKIFHAPSGRRTAALAEHLQALHAFREDLAEALGLTSHYNEGLGTTNEKHLYDRVKNRDSGPNPRPWDRA